MQSLTFDQISAFARGYAWSEVTDAGLAFRRLPRPNHEHYVARSEGAGIRACCTAGVRLVFASETRRLALRCALGRGARKVAHLDILFDGRHVASLGSDEPGEFIEGTIELPAAPGEKLPRIEIWLPQSRECALQSLEIDDGASAEPLPAGRTLLALGDSITQGMDGAHPAHTYAATAARRLGLDLHNAAIGGDRFGAESLIEPVAATPTLITVAYGTNDWSGSCDPAEARRYLQRVRELWPAAPVVLLEPVARTNPGEDGPGGRSNERGQTMGAYREALRAIAAEFADVRYVLSGRLLPALPRLFKDGLHPNTEGHIIYGENVAAELADLIRG